MFDKINITEKIPYPFHILTEENMNKKISITLQDFLTGFETELELKTIQQEFKKFEGGLFDVNKHLKSSIENETLMILGASLELYIECQEIEQLYRGYFSDVPTTPKNKLEHFHIFNCCTSAAYASK